MTADEIARIVDEAAARHGVPSDALMAIANLESSGNIGADNPRSSASGLFQFVDSTAREYGLTGSKRNDPAAQADAAARMMATNARSLSRTLGREPNAGELYLAHQQGLGGASALLRNPNRPAIDVLADVYGSREKAQNAIRQNGGQAGQSAGQFANRWIDKANRTAQMIPPASVPNMVASQLDTSPSQTMTGRSNAPTSAASQAVPTNWFTPRLAPGDQDIFSYQIPDQTPASLAGGRGSLTPEYGTRNVPMPRLDPRLPNRMDLNPTPANVMRQELGLQGQSYAARDGMGPAGAVTLSGNVRGTTPATYSPSANRLPRIDVARPQTYAAQDNAQTAMQAAARIPVTQSNLVSRLPPIDPVDPGLRRALEMQQSGIGQPPATRVVPSVPIRPQPTGPALSRDSVLQGQRGSYMAQALPNVMTPRQSAPQPVMAVPNAIPGPAPVIKTADALTPGLYPQVGTALDVVPNSVPGLSVTGYPTSVGLRPGQPVTGFPTALTQRPMPQPALRVTVNGAGSYNAPAPQPTREQQIAAILARSRGPSAFGGGGTIDGAVQPIGTLTGRR